MTVAGSGRLRRPPAQPSALSRRVQGTRRAKVFGFGNRGNVRRNRLLSRTESSQVEGVTLSLHVAERYSGSTGERAPSGREAIYSQGVHEDMLRDFLIAAIVLVVPSSIVAQEGPWDREWEEVPSHQVFVGMTEATVLPAEIRFRTYWDVAALIPKWHAFHMLMKMEEEGRLGGRFSTSLINCTDGLLLDVRETFMEDAEIVFDEGLQEEQWKGKVRTLTAEDRATFRESFESWAIDAAAVCDWINRKT